MTKAINYMQKAIPTPPNDPSLITYALKIQQLLQTSFTFQRSGPVFIRKVNPAEVGTILKTYIKDPITGMPKLEGEGITLLEGMFILRNPTPLCKIHVIGKEPFVYNEYATKDLAYMVKTYGQSTMDELTDTFQLKRKKGLFKALKITKELFHEFMSLDCVDDKGRIHIAVDFEPFVMYAYLGGWLNNNGYAIGEEEMHYYEAIEDTTSDLDYHGLFMKQHITSVKKETTKEIGVFSPK